MGQSKQLDRNHRPPVGKARRKMPPPTGGLAVELCCGMGGIRIGLEAAGYTVVKAYDSWPDAVAVYNHNAPSPVATACDILSKAGRNLIRKDCRSPGEIDLLAAGPPCKGFSQIRNGRHDGPNAHNDVLLAIPQYLGLLRPRMLLIENVPALARHQRGETLRDLLSALEAPGPRGLRYRVEYGVYDAAQFGTPQARRRLLILAVRRSCGDEHLPSESPDLSPLYAALRHGGAIPERLHHYRDMLSNDQVLTMTTAAQALSDLPHLGPGEPERLREYASDPATAYQRAVRAGAGAAVRDTQTPAVKLETVERLKMIPAGGCARDIPDHLLNGLSRRYDSAYRRLHPDAPSTALSTKYDCVYHHEVDRSLSVREYARLQGIPDRFTFPASLTCRRYAYEMIGNAVPPRLVQGIVSRMAGPSSSGGPV